MNTSRRKLLGRKFFRRSNYSEVHKNAIYGLLPALDLLTPHGNEKNTTRRLVIESGTLPTIVIKKKTISGERKFVFEITNEILDTLQSFRLIPRPFFDIFRGKKITEKRARLLEGLLEEWDRMHVGRTKNLKTGIYWGFNSKVQRRVIGMVRESEGGDLLVRYEQYGVENSIRECSSVEFTKIIYDIEGNFGPAYSLVEEERRIVTPMLRLVGAGNKSK